MKYLLKIIALSLLLSMNAYADKEYLESFNEFISDNSKYLSEHDIKGLKIVNICKEEKKFSKKWMENECEFMAAGVFELQNKLKLNFTKIETTYHLAKKQILIRCYIMVLLA